jgi:hypothetical protein
MISYLLCAGMISTVTILYYCVSWGVHFIPFLTIKESAIIGNAPILSNGSQLLLSLHDLLSGMSEDIWRYVAFFFALSGLRRLFPGIKPFWYSAMAISFSSSGFAIMHMFSRHAVNMGLFVDHFAVGLISLTLLVWLKSLWPFMLGHALFDLTLNWSTSKNFLLELLPITPMVNRILFTIFLASFCLFFLAIILRSLMPFLQDAPSDRS